MLAAVRPQPTASQPVARSGTQDPGCDQPYSTASAVTPTPIPAAPNTGNRRRRGRRSADDRRERGTGELPFGEKPAHRRGGDPDPVIARLAAGDQHDTRRLVGGCQLLGDGEPVDSR